MIFACLNDDLRVIVNGNGDVEQAAEQQGSTPRLNSGEPTIVPKGLLGTIAKGGSMSDKPESSKTQLETLKADLLEKLSAKLKPDSKPSPVFTKPVNIHVELNQKLLELLEEGTDESREKAKKLPVDRNALLVAGDANTAEKIKALTEAVESLTQQSFTIQSLVGALSDPPVRLMRHLGEPLFQKDFLLELPKELAYRIIAHLTPRDLMTCAGVSQTWQRICEDDHTWRQKCFENGYVEFDTPSFRFLGGWAANRANEQGEITISSHMDLPEAQQNRQAREIAYGHCYERSSWKSLYLRKRRIISNWRSRAIQSTTVLKDDFLYQVLYPENQSARIITGSYDTVRVWNVEDAQPAFTLTGHPWSFQVSGDGKYIVNGEQDGTLRVWCGRTGAQLHVLRGHTGWISCMSLHGTTLVSVSNDQTLRVWDIVDGKCLHILAVDFWNCVKFDGERVVGCGHDGAVNVWNVHTGECLHMLTGHTESINSLLFEPERDLVVSGGSDGTIRVWDVQRGTCIAHFVFHEGSRLATYECGGMQLRGNILVRFYDSDIWVWDIREGGSCIHHLHGGNGQTESITTMQLLDSRLLVTSSEDGSVKLWDVEKGTFVRDLVRSRSGDRRRYYCHLGASETLLVCGVRSVDRTEEGKIILIDFDASYP